MKKCDLNGDGIITFGEYEVALDIAETPVQA